MTSGMSCSKKVLEAKKGSIARTFGVRGWIVCSLPGSGLHGTVSRHDFFTSNYSDVICFALFDAQPKLLHRHYAHMSNIFEFPV